MRATDIYDSDAYGVNTDLSETISDFFFPSKAARESARVKFDNALAEILEEIAIDNGFPYEEYKKWDAYDWDEFRECLDI